MKKFFSFVLLSIVFSAYAQESQTSKKVNLYASASAGLSFAVGSFAEGGIIDNDNGSAGIGPRGDVEAGFFTESGFGVFGSANIQFFETDEEASNADVYWIFMGASVGPQYRVALTDKLYGVAKGFIGILNADLTYFDRDSDALIAYAKRVFTYGGKLGFTYMVTDDGKWAIDGLMGYHGLKANHDQGDLGLGNELDVNVGFLSFNAGLSYYF